MRWSLPFLFALLPLSGLAKKSYSRCKPKNSATQTEPKSPYILQDFYHGNSFLSDSWVFFSGSDPTFGNVEYQTKEAAIKKKLAFVKNGVATLAVDSSSNVRIGGNRDSVRISTRKTYNHGLFIADFKAMPYGCGVWPAYWSTGPDWPRTGEIDIVEGVNNQHTNQYTLHSGPGCSLPTATNHSVTGKLLSTTCTSSGSSNDGCAYSDPNPDSYGAHFDNGNGGVFAHLWNDAGIAVWHFPRHSIPQDITAKQPNPSQWHSPVAFFPSIHCDIKSHFSHHTLILDISLCGDFVDSMYPTSGCPGTCAQAVANSANFKNAKWEINYISVYQPR